MKTCLSCYSSHFYIIVKTFKIRCHNLNGLIDENILPLNFIQPPPQFHKTAHFFILCTWYFTLALLFCFICFFIQSKLYIKQSTWEKYQKGINLSKINYLNERKNGRFVNWPFYEIYSTINMVNNKIKKQKTSPIYIQL